jgi:inosose dehydratase
MQVCLHHHMGTGIQTTAEIDKFMSLVDDNVFLLFDTGHAWYSEGGEAPMLAILKISAAYQPRAPERRTSAGD